MPRAPYSTTGYIYAIRDPRHGKYAYLGTSWAPWDVIQSILTGKRTDKTAARVRAWVAEWASLIPPNGIDWHTSIIIDNFERQLQGLPPEPLPPLRDGCLELKWDVLAFYQRPEFEISANGVAHLSEMQFALPLSYWHRKLVSEGHPLITKVPGRPRKGQ